MTASGDVRDEVRRQIQRVNDDRVPRILGASSAFVLVTGFADARAMLAAASVYALTEFLQFKLFRRTDVPFGTTRYAGALANVMVGATAFSVPAIVLWSQDAVELQVASVLFLAGALVNCAMVRATHLPMGLATALPPALTLLLLTMPRAGTNASEEMFRFAMVVVLLAYFVAAMVANNRAQRALIVASRGAHAASEAKSRFLTAMSHDIRTPLNAIQGMAQLLLSEGPTPVVRDRAATIEGAAGTLRAIVDDVLDLASVRDDAIRPVPVTARLVHEIDTVLAQARPLARARGQRLRADLGDLPPLAGFDPVRLRQCLRNALGAAMDRLGPGDVVLTAICRPGGSDRARLEVTITGQFSGQVSGAVAGSGPPQMADLRASLAQGLAMAMGGAFDLPVDHDAPFRLTVDLLVVAPGAVPAATPAGRWRILVVDDIATNRLVVQHMLRRDGIVTIEAADGPSALSRLAGERFDLVLLDMNMPGMDGAATLAAIRASAADWAGLPVIGLTADAKAEERRTALMAAGLTSLIVKPVDRAVLMAELARALNWAGRPEPESPFPGAVQPEHDPARQSASDPAHDRPDEFTLRAAPRNA